MLAQSKKINDNGLIGTLLYVNLGEFMNGRQLLRAKKMIESDRLGLVFGSEDLIRRDVENMLSQYFSLSAPVIINLTKINGKIKIEILTECSGVKRFVVLDADG